jgi:hypothetical protein
MSAWDRERPSNRELAVSAEAWQMCPECGAAPGDPCHRMAWKRGAWCIRRGSSWRRSRHG